MPEPSATPTGWLALGGQRLWLIDRKSGRIVACWTESSALVDAGRTISCTNKRTND
jgi:hypothetical protein